ncbi:diaminopimelate epimerase [Leptomonas pyrrhocoris]|uniref:Diaminopimelate epimerase n=1 Tax=Leptomonas pyrrhocoris TaxID=157538 RepID=A0A0N0VHJ5_LEPPY|nr:diaminopimelate epimerase [Leptomonas pyrrhocoris]KPA85574.1 diaminopimelate epimerase [Leptomonas pyrrhocoris]|eukprot:XP_015664013.1 diaminopimelate epimerase [Leptomonas pyrrhocoris]
MSLKMIEFTKMHSSGNDYVYVNTVKYPLANPSALSIQWSAAHTGIGSDGLVLIGTSTVADFSMRIFNADGSKELMCGNATICVGKYLHDKKLTTKIAVTLETLPGVKQIQLHVGDNGEDTVTVNMGYPSIENLNMTVECGTLCVVGTAVSMGNPHFVVLVNDVDEVDLGRVGPLIEHHQLFEDRTNVEVAHVCADDAIRMRVWERGSGITQGCGSGACAAAVAAMAHGCVSRSVSVHMYGGTVRVRREQGGAVWITGLAVSVFDGTISV